jgi:hypothetical protein
VEDGLSAAVADPARPGGLVGAIPSGFVALSGRYYDAAPTTERAAAPDTLPEDKTSSASCVCKLGTAADSRLSW